MSTENTTSDTHTWQQDIEAAFSYRGVIGGAYLVELINREHEAGAAFVEEFTGHRLITDAFFDFLSGTLTAVAETVKKEGWPRNAPDYPIALTMFLTAFRTARAAEIMSLHGYFYQGYSQLRSVKDQAFALGGATAGAVSIGELFGLEARNEPKIQPESSKVLELQIRARRTAEAKTVKFLIESGLSDKTRAEMVRWNHLFNWEAHRGLFTYFHDLGRLVDHDPMALTISPLTDGIASATFMNRSAELSWLLHRLLPMLQTPSLTFTDDWVDKWELLDRSFKILVNSLAEIGKNIGPAFVEFVEVKFNWGPSTPSFLVTSQMR